MLAGSLEGRLDFFWLSKQGIKSKAARIGAAKAVEVPRSGPIDFTRGHLRDTDWICWATSRSMEPMTRPMNIFAPVLASKRAPVFINAGPPPEQLQVVLASAHQSIRTYRYLNRGVSQLRSGDV